MSDSYHFHTEAGFDRGANPLKLQQTTLDTADLERARRLLNALTYQAALRAREVAYLRPIVERHQAGLDASDFLVLLNRTRRDTA